MKPNRPHRFCSKEAAALLVPLALAAVLWVLENEEEPPVRASGAKASFSSSLPRNRRSDYANASRTQREEVNPERSTAFAAALALENPAQREETLTRLCYERAADDPREALELAIEHGLEKSPGVMANLTQQWAAADLRAARAWAESQAAGAMRGDLIARIGYVWSLSDPAAAADFITRETPPGEAQTEAAIAVLHRWREQDPAAARAWVECFPAGPARERALYEVSASQAPGD